MTRFEPTPEQAGRHAVRLYEAMRWMQRNNVERVDRMDHAHAINTVMPELQRAVDKACGA